MGVDNLATRLRLFIQGKKLKNLDLLSKSDPYCKMLEQVNHNWVDRGKTETIMNDLNPSFKTSFEIDYYFEKIQPLRFILMDQDKNNADDMIGEVDVLLAKVWGSKGNIIELPLTFKGKANGRGSVIVRIETIVESSLVYKL